MARHRQTAVNASEQDDYLDRVKDEIRKEAELARQRHPLPRRDPAARASQDPPVTGAAVRIERDRLEYALPELTGLHYIAFVDNAFRALLKREPDDGGSHAQIRLLASGATKAEVLGNLRWSREGKQVGVRVRGLLPRYAMAKLARIPGLGYFVEWAIAFAGLPMLLRHQRAADTSTAAGFNAALDAQARAERELSELRALNATLGAAHAALAAEHVASCGRQLAIDSAHAERSELLARDIRLAQHQVDGLLAERSALDQRMQASANERVELRHLVHTVNHWLVSLQRSLDDLESTENEARAGADMLASRVNDSPVAADARRARYRDWSETLARQLPARALVLDLGSGDGAWLAMLVSQGLDASGVETNPALVQRARAQGTLISAGDLLASLMQCNDASLDAITVGRAALPDDDVGMDRLMREIARALKPRGVLLARIEREPFRLVSQGASIVDAHRWSAIVVAAGFAPAEVLSGDDGIAVLTRRP